VQRALAADTRLTTWQVLLAWNAAVDEARAFRLEESTLPIQLRLREIYQDAWSANELALTYKALGQGQAADRLLGEAISAELETGRRAAELWETRGINALAFGSEGLARDYLGKAMAYGSPGAALLLARLDLSAGRTTQARSAFRALLLDQPSPDWAWRGWGMALLPDPIVAPGSLSPVLSKP
jgi:tetratricopeptide (TPR) repeat protein